MAPVFRHGKGTRVLINKSDFSGYLNQSTVSASCDAAEVTTYQNNDKKYIPGLRDFTMSMDGLFSWSTVSAAIGSPGAPAQSSEIDAWIPGLLGGSTRTVITLGPEGDANGRRALLGAGDLTGYNINQPVADAVSLSMDVQGSDGYRGGMWLRGLSTCSSSTGSDTSVDAGVTYTGSTAGLVAHFHAPRINAAGTLTVKVQHSSNGAAWSDLITFTALSTAGWQRSTAAGTIKRFLRTTRSAFGAGGQATYAVAAARQGKFRQ